MSSVNRKHILIGIKLFHTVAFLLISGCVLYMLYCGVLGKTTMWLWVSIVVVITEMSVYTLNGFRCPLTKLALQYGDEEGGHDFIADIFLPHWFIPMIVPLCTVLAISGFILTIITLMRIYGTI